MKMSGEWLKQTVQDLINAYKQNENLYNPKHKLYYNKKARSTSIENILQCVKKTKEDATINDVIKKIQILRTQYGQEINKIEKSKSLGDELMYTPKIWWFKNLSFIAKFMKMRSVQSVSLKLDQQKSYNQDSNNEEETLFEIVEATDNIIEEDLEQSDEQTPKKRRIEFSSSITNSSLNRISEPRTIEYIINEETSELIPNEQLNNVSITESDRKTLNCERLKRKSKAFGKYVGCLMREFNDDKLFFEAQTEILKVIEKTALKFVQNK